MPHYKLLHGNHSVIVNGDDPIKRKLITYVQGDVFYTTQILDKLNSQGSSKLLRLEGYTGTTATGVTKVRSPKNFQVEGEEEEENTEEPIETSNGVDIDGMTVPQLREYAEAEGVDIDGLHRKVDIKAAIEASLQMI